MADADKDGFLTKSELTDFYEINNYTLNQDELNQIYLVVDVDPKDDQLSEDEVFAFYDQMDEEEDQWVLSIIRFITFFVLR